MERPAITALTAQLRRYVDLSKSRLETMALLTVGMIGARTVNLVHIADERGSTTVDPASTYRRLQRFFQHVRLEEDWSAPLLAGFAGGAEKRTLIIDRTNWKVGETHINLFVLAIRTRHSQVPLMWTVLDKAGTSDMEERIALIQRYIACFGKHTIKMLLADREFVGDDWFNYLADNDIPFTIRLPNNRVVTLDNGRKPYLADMITLPSKGRRITATLNGMTKPLIFAAVTPKGRERVIVATNVPGHNPLTTYRKRWAIESLFGNTKTRGLNFEDTKLTAPAKLALLTAIVALAIAWSVRAARTVLGQNAPPRKAHGYLAKSYFRVGFTHLRNLMRANDPNIVIEWVRLKISGILVRVV